MRSSVPYLFAMGLLIGCAAAGCNRPASGDAADPLLAPYLSIGEALAKDDLSGVAAPSSTLKASLAEDAARGNDALSRGASAVDSGDIEMTRAAFKTLSTGVIEYMKANPSTQEGHMLVHCPMTFDNVGALWVQKTGKVQNPYEGSRMLTCGSKVEWSAELPET